MRIWKPERIFFVTNRCEQERFFLLPRKGLRELIGAWLAKSLEEHGHGIELYAFVFMSNHFHLLLKDKHGNLPAFMGFFQRNLAVATNRDLGRRGHFFASPYDAAPVLTDDMFENRYAYITANAVKAGLVAKVDDSPFFSSMPQALDGKPRTFEWKDRTKLHNKTRRGNTIPESDYTKPYKLKLAVPPMWKNKTRAARKTRILDLARANEVRYGKARRAEGRTVLGKQRIRAQSPFMRPSNPDRSPRVPVFCSDPVLEKEFREEVRATVSAYKTAFAAFMTSLAKGRHAAAVGWPPWTYPPSCLAPTTA